MTKVTFSPDNVTIECFENENILASGLRNNFNLPHSCKNGNCSACKCKLISGEITHDDIYSPMALNEYEKEKGLILLCKSYPKSDVVIKLPSSLKSHPVKILISKVTKIEKHNSVCVITLKLPQTVDFKFDAGQYVDVILKGKNRSYSIANNPEQSGVIELHIKYQGNGVFSEYAFNELEQDAIIRFKGPLGSFKLSDTDKPIIMACTGTGFAPIKAILDHMVATNNQRQVMLYWGNRTADDFYFLDKLDYWKQNLNIKITKCVSQVENPEDGYTAGYVTGSIINDYQDLSNHELYACGNQVMISDLYDVATTNLSLQRKNFFSDAFTPSEV